MKRSCSFQRQFIHLAPLSVVGWLGLWKPFTPLWSIIKLGHFGHCIHWLLIKSDSVSCGACGVPICLYLVFWFSYLWHWRLIFQMDEVIGSLLRLLFKEPRPLHAQHRNQEAKLVHPTRRIILLLQAERRTASNRESKANFESLNFAGSENSINIKATVHLTLSRSGK